MTEATLKGALVQKAKETLPGWVIIRHEDQFRAGVPDISATGNGKTSWWEVKFANPGFSSKGIQDLTLQRLDRAGMARYIIYEKSSLGNTVRIVLPRDLENWRNIIISRPGFDHNWVVQKMRELHGTDH